MCRITSAPSLSIRPSARSFCRPMHVAVVLMAVLLGTMAAAGENPPIPACLQGATIGVEGDSGGCDEAQMNRLCEQIIQMNRHDRRFVEKFKAAQAAWRQFRDAHLASLFPAEDKVQAYGSVYGECVQRAARELTCERIEQLYRWVKGVPEGEVCAGSLPIQ